MYAAAVAASAAVVLEDASACSRSRLCVVLHRWRARGAALPASAPPAPCPHLFADVLLINALSKGDADSLLSCIFAIYSRMLGGSAERLRDWLRSVDELVLVAVAHAVTAPTPGHLHCIALLCALGFPANS